MRLVQLYLDGFGHFNQRTFALPDGKVAVFYGPNEAGKSTLLAFIRTVLFGFPARNRDSHFPPLAGGRHGGRIYLSTESGESYTLERYAGARGGPLTVLDDAGRSLDSALVMPQVMGQATEPVFNHVFAFNIDELQQMGLAEGSAVNDAIYSAGQGVPGLSGFSQQLTARQQDIFRERGSAQQVPRLVKDIGQLDDQLRTIAENGNRYGSLTSRRAEIDSQIQTLISEHSRCNAQLSELRNLLEGWDDWVELTGCISRIEALPQYEQFPDDAVPRLEAIQERVRLGGIDFEEANERLKLADEAVAAEIPDEILLEAAVPVEDIRRDRGRFDESVRDLPERQAELRAMEDNFTARLKDLGRPWDEAALEDFDTSVIVRAQVDAWKERLDRSGEGNRQAVLRLEQERRSQIDRKLETGEAKAQVPEEPPALDAAGLRGQQEALRTARGCLAEYERQRQNHENLRRQLNALTSGASSGGGSPVPGSGWLTVLLAVAGIALAATGAALGWPALPVGLAGGLVLIVAAAALWFRGRTGASPEIAPISSPLGRQTADAEGEEERARRALLSTASTLGLDGQPDGPALDSAEARLEDIRVRLAAWDAANTRVEEASRREASQEQRLTDAAQAQEGTAASYQEATEEWQQWLQERHLDGGLTPEGMAAFLANVDATRNVLGETRRMRARVAAIETDIEEFRQKVQPLASAHDILADGDNWGQLKVAADTLISRLEQAREGQSRRGAALEQQEDARRTVQEREKRLKDARLELETFLALGGTDDPEEFRRRARDNESRRELELRRGELRRSLERLSGPADKFDAFCGRLTDADQSALNADLDEIEGTIRDGEAQRSDLLEERGGIENELERLTGEEESSRLRVRRETLVEQLRECAREWYRLTFAQELLERTRQKFEVERQPKVVQHAQDFFSRITGQRYTRLFVPIGERSVTVMDGAGGTKTPPELSRGTREQLYLALRFGLVREFGEHAERLPVVVDEVLVNFDPERARLAAESFAELSETNQVLVFTCHPAMAELFAEVADAEVIDVESLVSSGT